MPEHGEQTQEPCVVHKTHEPRSRIQEAHHVFPKWLQALAYGDTVVHDTQTIAVCATGHNNIHLCIDDFIATGKWTSGFTVMETMYAQECIAAFKAAGGTLADALAHIHGQGE